MPKSAVADWQRSFRRLFKLAGLEKPDGTVKRCFPHMLRDTFAVEMLLAGVPIDQVSMLLGHSSVKITEKHYSPWVKARQDQLAASVRNAWTDFGGRSTPDAAAVEGEGAGLPGISSGNLFAMVDPDQNTLRDSQVLIGPFARGLTPTPTQDSVFAVEEAPHRLFTDAPQLGYLGHGIVALQSH